MATLPLPTNLRAKDLNQLRNWINRILAGEPTTVHSLIYRQNLHAKDDLAKFKLRTLNRLLKDKHHTFNVKSYDRLQGLYDYLSSEYLSYRDEEVTYVERLLADLFPTPDALLAFALTKFFAEHERAIVHRVNIADMRKILIGRYVMYRLDVEPATHDGEPNDLVRASLLEFSESDHGIHVSETQTFPKTTTYRGNTQTNTGVMGTYGQFMIGLLRTETKTSFKCMVIDNFVPRISALPAPIEMFWGKLFVASELALYPSARIVCERINGDKYLHGLHSEKKIKRDIVKFLKTATFSDFPIVP